MKLSRLISICLAVCLAIPLSAARTSAAEICVIEPGSEPLIAGKEVDWIYGDHLMMNDQISFVIAAPLATRDANVTIRNIGASILDLTLNQTSNDQLSAYTPAAGRYLFHDPLTVEAGKDGDAVSWQCRSSRTIINDGTTATVRYRLADGDAFVEAMIKIAGDEAAKAKAFEGVRADGWFSFKNSGSVAYCKGSFFRQTIGFKSPSFKRSPTWKKGRPYQLHFTDEHVQRSDGKLTWTVHVYPATSPIDLFAVAEQTDLSPEKENTSDLPKGYLEVGSEKEGALRELCQATADTGLFSGAVLVAEKGKVI